MPRGAVHEPLAEGGNLWLLELPGAPSVAASSALGGQGHLEPPAGPKADHKSLPDSILPSWLSGALSEALVPLGKGWWLKRSSHRRLRHSLVRKRRTYPTLFTTGRLRKCCFPSKEAETGRAQTQLLRAELWRKPQAHQPWGTGLGVVSSAVLLTKFYLDFTCFLTNTLFQFQDLIQEITLAVPVA